ncbi:GTPase activating protein 1-like [Aristolochia californica]|uniref:GTPase activating protein 1-like n=1 Tax=Aristolochia californica TaxID=171875 RepID=UPI0035D5667B
MDQLLGLLKVRVVRGINLAVRDIRSSDPYCVLRMGNKLKLKTGVIKHNVNPEWNEELTFSVAEPIMPIKIQVYDKDTFTQDDSMGDTELDIQPFIEAVKLNLERAQDGTVLNKIQPSRQNCLSEESRIVLLDGKVTQYACLRLRNVECGEVELQLQWFHLPGKRHVK